MFGILIGTVCLIALFKVLRHGRHGWGWHGHPGHHGGGGCGGRGYRGFRGGGRGHGPLRWIFWRLDTTVGQEKLMQQELEHLQGPFEALRGDFQQVRQAAAAAFRADNLDAASLDALFRQHEELVGKAKQAVHESLQKVHAGLDPQQRKVIADWIESGPRLRRC